MRDSSVDFTRYPNESLPVFFLLVGGVVCACFSLPFPLAAIVVEAISPSLSVQLTTVFDIPPAIIIGLTSVCFWLFSSVLFLYLDMRHLDSKWRKMRLMECMPELAAEIEKRCQGLPEFSRAKFYATASVVDTNAMTYGVLGSFRVVLGGGLKLLFRRNPKIALAIVEHELAHIQNNDVTTIMVARAAVRAYLVLISVSALMSFSTFFVAWYSMLDEYREAGLPLYFSFVENIHRGLDGALRFVLLAILFWILYRRLVQFREFFADALVNERESLSSIFARKSLQVITPLREKILSLVRLHPSPSCRLARLQIISTWGSYELSYLAIIGTLGGLVTGATFFLPSASSAVGAVTLFVAEILMVCGLVAHVCRVAAIQEASGLRHYARLVRSLWISLVMVFFHQVGMALLPVFAFPVKAVSVFIDGAYPDPVETFLAPIALVPVMGYLSVCIPVATFGAWLVNRWPVKMPTRYLAVICLAGFFSIGNLVLAWLLLSLKDSGVDIAIADSELDDVMFDAIAKATVGDIVWPIAAAVFVPAFIVRRAYARAFRSRSA